MRRAVVKTLEDQGPGIGKQRAAETNLVECAVIRPESLREMIESEHYCSPLEEGEEAMPAQKRIPKMSAKTSRMVSPAVVLED